MTDTIRRADYYYTKVKDAPGEAYRLLSHLKEKGVNLTVFSAFPSEGGMAQVDFVPEDPAEFEKVCRVAGVALSAKKQCFIIGGADRPGAVADILKRLADAKVNGTALDAVCAGSGRYGAILWVKPEAMAAAAKALGV